MKVIETGMNVYIVTEISMPNFGDLFQSVRKTRISELGLKLISATDHSDRAFIPTFNAAVFTQPATFV